MSACNRRRAPRTEPLPQFANDEQKRRMEINVIVRKTHGAHV